MKRFWIMLLLLAAPLAAQEEKKAGPPPVPRQQKLFVLKYVDPKQIDNLLRALGASSTYSSELHALAVQASAETMPAIEEAIKRLDVPAAPPPTPPNIDLTAYYVTASDGEALGGSLPKELDPVVTQLKNTFPFKSYRLLTILTLRTRSGDNAETLNAAQPEGRPLPFIINFRGTPIASSEGSTMRINNLRADMKVPISNAPAAGFNYQDIRLATDVDIKEGQKVVVGRLGIGKDQALFLVLTARIAN